MAIIEGAGGVSAGGSLGRAKPARGLYEFAVDGGAVGAITLRGDRIPAGAIIVDALIHVDTAVTGATATVSVGTEAAADILTATAISTTPWSTTGAKRATFVATTAPIKTTVARNISVTVATAALTAGKFSVVVWYLELA